MTNIVDEIAQQEERNKEIRNRSDYQVMDDQLCAVKNVTLAEAESFVVLIQQGILFDDCPREVEILRMSNGNLFKGYSFLSHVEAY